MDFDFFTGTEVDSASLLTGGESASYWRGILTEPTEESGRGRGVLELFGALDSAESCLARFGGDGPGRLKAVRMCQQKEKTEKNIRYQATNSTSTFLGPLLEGVCHIHDDDI